MLFMRNLQHMSGIYSRDQSYERLGESIEVDPRSGPKQNMISNCEDFRTFRILEVEVRTEFKLILPDLLALR